MVAIKNQIYCGNTEFQKIEIVDTFNFGRCLILDGKIQSTEMDEYIYHEALVHPAMILHSGPRKILIIGGGEGAVIREVLKHPLVETITMVDLDREVVDLCRKHLPSWHEGAFDGEKVELLHMDARRYLADTDRKFDLIISDLTEPVDDGPSYLLFTREFYNILMQRLAPGGILTLQSGSFSLQYIEAHAAIRNTLQTCFEIVRSYQAYVPSFDSPWGFNIASREDDPLKLSPAEVDSRIKLLGADLEFYDGYTHRHMFSIPKDIRRALAEDNTIIEDQKPLIIY
ncbi:MAG: polyamine aminopropyltransferase [Firmicutes bacterium]|nr:polyamine aminopropyltransferase [Bacillota bacterium]